MITAVGAQKGMIDILRMKNLSRKISRVISVKRRDTMQGIIGVKILQQEKMKILKAMLVLWCLRRLPKISIDGLSTLVQVRI
jgi:hypothetical protein